MSFLDRSFELHFNERPYLNHFSYLFITKTTRERSRSRSNFSILCRGNIIPKEVRDKETVSLFLESVDQFERILNDSVFIRLERLTTDEIVGTPQQAGLIEKYFSLSQQDTTTLKDIQMSASKMRIGDNTLCVHTLSDVDDLPGSVQTDTRYEKYSTDRSDCRLSFAAPVGLMLSCDHIYNQFLFIDDSAEILQRFEKTARNMHSLSKYSRANQLNKQWIDAYLDEAHSFGLTAIRCHCNVMAWSDNREKLKVIKNDTGSALALMGCKPRYNTIDAPALYWAGIPGGIFTPALSVGAMIGQQIAQFASLETGANVLVLICMAAFLAAATQSPLTASVIVMEMTGGQNLLFWLLIGAIFASQVSRQFSPKPFYHAAAARFRQRVQEEYAEQAKLARAEKKEQ